jgi:hypothetical protein
MIDDILHIQAKHTDLPLSISLFISRDAASLRAMNTSLIEVYLYRGQLMAEVARQHCTTMGQQTITKIYEQIRQQQTGQLDTTATSNTTL